MDQNIDSYQYVMDLIIVWLSRKKKAFILLCLGVDRVILWKVYHSYNQLSLRFINEYEYILNSAVAPFYLFILVWFYFNIIRKDTASVCASVQQLVQKTLILIGLFG